MKRNSAFINNINCFLKKIYLLCWILLILVFIPQNTSAQQQPEGIQIIAPKEGSTPKQGELIELNFQDIEVRLLLDIVSQFSGKSFLFQERDLKNRKITLISPEKYSIDEAYEIFEKILSVNDLRLIQEENNIIRVVNVNEAKNSLTSAELETEVGFGDDIVVTRVINITNTNINTVFKAINPFLSKTGTITRFDGTNSFIVKDTKENANRLAELVKIFDTKTDYQVKTYTLKYIPVNQLKPILEKVIRKENTTSKSQYFSYNTNKNTVIAVARTNEIKILENLIKRLDVSVKKTKKDGFDLKFIPVQHLKVSDAISFVQKVFGSSAPPKGGSLVIEGSIIIKIDDTNSFIAYGPRNSITRIEQLIAEVDQEEENVILEVISILYSDVNTVSKLVKQVFENRTASASPLKLKIFIEAGTNSLILLGTEKTINRVRVFVEKFDKPRSLADSQGFKFYFYPVQNARATNIATILNNLSGNIINQADTNAETVTQTTSTTKNTDKNKKPTKTPVTIKNPTTNNKNNQLSITADEETNSLIIYANQLQYNIIKNAIDDLDIVRPQVFVEALIVEVSLNKNLNLGVRYGGVEQSENSDQFTGANILGAPITPEGAVNQLQGNTGSVIGTFGNIFSYRGQDFFGYSAFINALASDEEINILSNPKIITLNNKKASINVGENRAFQTSNTINSNGIITPNFEYRDVGIKLEILPQINAGNYITMEIEQTNTSLSRAGSIDANRPTTLKRVINTEVIVKSGTTITLGGLINEEKISNDSKVPCLGDIPGLGYLFKSQTNTSRKTNLVIFLTPTIVRSEQDQNKVTKKSLQQIKTPIKKIGEHIQIKLDDLLNENSTTDNKENKKK